MGVDWKGILKGAAPAIATALVNPGAGAALALRTLSGALLKHENGTEEQVAAAVAGATPEQLERMAQADRDFSIRLVELAASFEKIEADDRANARAMQSANHSIVPDVITYSFIILFAGALVALIWIPVPAENKVQVDAMVETLKLLNMTAVGFWLGGSVGSRTKDAVLGRLAGR